MWELGWTKMLCDRKLINVQSMAGARDLNAETPTTDATGWTFEPHLDH